MEVKKTQIPDVKIIIPEVYGDDRGFFLKALIKKTYKRKLA